MFAPHISPITCLITIEVANCMLNYPYVLHCYNSTQGLLDRTKGLRASNSPDIIPKGCGKLENGMLNDHNFLHVYALFFSRRHISVGFFPSQKSNNRACAPCIPLIIRIKVVENGQRCALQPFLPTQSRVKLPRIPIISCTKVVENGGPHAVQPFPSAQLRLNFLTLLSYPTQRLWDIENGMLNNQYFLHSHDLSSSHSPHIRHKGRGKR